MRIAVYGSQVYMYILNIHSTEGCNKENTKHKNWRKNVTFFLVGYLHTLCHLVILVGYSVVW